MDETALRIMHLHAQGYCCSQIMIKLSLEDMGEENIPLVRAMAGLCEGSSTGDLCGVASGVACVLSLYAAKGSDDEPGLLPDHAVAIHGLVQARCHHLGRHSLRGYRRLPGRA